MKGFHSPISSVDPLYETFGSTMYPTRNLARSDLFRTPLGQLSGDEQASLSYLRAKAIAKAYSLNVKDILGLSKKFWQFHTDPIWCMDGAAGSLMTIQLNLCAGTIANYLAKHPNTDVQEILNRIMSFEYSGQFCLTEVGHGLDALHIETTAKLLDDGHFELNTPSEKAAKYMPPSKPMGDKCVGVVFARAVVEGQDRGIKAFLVPINDGINMYPGITCKCLPHRGGSYPMNHSLTYFHNVRLPASSLLGTLEKPKDPRQAFHTLISRVAIGTLAIGSLGVPGLQASSYIAAKYSMRRVVKDKSGQPIPIMAFRTQKLPILTALAQHFVMKALHEHAVALFLNPQVDFRVRHAIATIVKVVMMQHGQTANLELGDRCGAQGLFGFNQLSAMFADMRGTAIAEGDILALSIKLASELLLERYSVPSPVDDTALLALHERGLISELKCLLNNIGDHRHEEFDRFVLPGCLPLVQAIGHRLAYEAAVKSGTEKCLIDLYVASCIKLDSSWYVENVGLSRAQQREFESNAIDAVFDKLETFFNETDVEPYITAPIVSDKSWRDFVESIHVIGGDSEVNGEDKVDWAAPLTNGNGSAEHKE